MKVWIGIGIGLLLLGAILFFSSPDQSIMDVAMQTSQDQQQTNLVLGGGTVAQRPNQVNNGQRLNTYNLKGTAALSRSERERQDRKRQYEKNLNAMYSGIAEGFVKKQKMERKRR